MSSLAKNWRHISKLTHSPIYLCLCPAVQIFRVRGISSKAVQLNQLLKSMKKQQSDHRLRHLKYRDKIGGKFPVPSAVEVQIVGSGGKGLPKAFLLATDHSNYLFNCGEGTQRIATECKLRLAKTENIFITHMSWDHVGGLLGMGLTLEQMRVPKLTIHGPPGVENVAMMARAFSESPTLEAEKKALGEGFFEDSGFKIEYVPFAKEGLSPERLKELLQEKPVTEPQQKKQKPEPVENAIAVAYICWPHPPQRKIILEKCVDLGIEKGPVIGRLKNGESITLDNGTVIHPDQVLDDPEISRAILVVDCPSEEYLESFVSNAQLSSHQGLGEENDKTPVLIIHMTPLAVFRTQRYQDWMNRFSEVTDHLILNELTSDVGFEGVYRYQSCLHLVHDSIFPHLRHLPLNEWPDVGSGTRMFREGGVLDGIEKRKGVVMGSTNLRYRYRPRTKVNRENCIQLDHSVFVSEVMQQEDVATVLQELRQRTGHVGLDTTDPGSSKEAAYPRLTFLGTGSSVPSKGRNVSGLLVHLREDATMILDCGEGTSGQLYRHFGSQTADILTNLKAVFISHLHADHHLGLFSLLRERRAVLEAAGAAVTPIMLLAPIQIRRWLQFYDDHVESVQSLYKYISLQDLLPYKRELPVNQQNYIDLLEKVSFAEFLPVEVEHCANAFGVSLTHSDGWKLVFSGDTVPCQRLVDAGKDCDILVHEATHEDDLEEEALRKRHSTTSQAIDIGLRMRARFIVLNHFSQRYAKIPFFKQAVPDNVGIAFDNMSVSMGELPLLSGFLPALKTLFAEEHTDLLARTVRRNRKKELLDKQMMEAKS